MYNWDKHTYGLCPTCSGRPAGIIQPQYYEYGEGPYGYGDYGHARKDTDVYDGTEDDVKKLVLFRGKFRCQNCINMQLRHEGSVRKRDNTIPTEKLIDSMGFTS